MRLKKIYKEFNFTEDDRGHTTLGTNVRLNPKKHWIQLKSGNAGYPTDPDLFAKTRLTIPQSGRGWKMFQVDVAHYKDQSGVIQTSVGFRLSTNGADELYWDGSSWVSANPGDWNTEEEVNAGIASFDSPRALQVVVNLKTNDVRFTPEVSKIRLMFESDIEFQEDYVRSLLRKLRAKIRPIARLMLASTSDQQSVSLGRIETPYNISQIDSVFDLTADPEKSTDLFSSYDSNVKVITLSAPIPTGNTILVQFEYQPEVAQTTSQDYTEISKIPGVVLEDFRTGQEHQLGACSLFNKVTSQGYVWRDGFQQDLDVPMTLITNKAFDQHRLADEMKSFFRSDPFLTSLGLDEKFRLWLIEEYDQLTVPAQNDLHTGRLRARIVKALFFPREAETVTCVTSFRVTGGNLSLDLWKDN